MNQRGVHPVKVKTSAQSSTERHHSLIIMKAKVKVKINNILNIMEKKNVRIMDKCDEYDNAQKTKMQLKVYDLLTWAMS